MKKIIVLWSMLALLLPATYGFSGMMGEQKGEMKQQEMMGEGQQMPMIKKMMGDGMMMQDMMQMMMDMMNMQEKMMMDMRPEEKKMMMKDMGQMKDKMQKMMSMHMGMKMATGDPQAKLKCAEQWLKKAIDLHEVHIKDPKTATEASQMEMMDQMKKAYGCITETGAKTKNAPTKEPAAGEKKKDAHVH